MFGNYTFALHAAFPNGSVIEPFTFQSPIYITVYYNLAGLSATYAANGGLLPNNVTQLNSSQASGGSAVPHLLLWDVTTDSWEDAASTCSPPNVTIDPVAFSYTTALCHLTDFASAFQLSPVVVLHPASLLPEGRPIITSTADALIPGSFLFQQSLDPWYQPVFIEPPLLVSTTYLLNDSDSSVPELLMSACQSYDPERHIVRFEWSFEFMQPSTRPGSNFTNRTSAAQSASTATLHQTASLDGCEAVLQSASVGLYLVSARAYDNNGAYTTRNLTIVVDHAPVVVLDAPEGGRLPSSTDSLRDLTVLLDASQSYDPDGDGIAWSWTVTAVAALSNAPGKHDGRSV